jgi:TPR repeat protein/transglutaminase-like putative cysteine protease
MYMRGLLCLWLAVLPGWAIADETPRPSGTEAVQARTWIDPGWRRTLARYDVRFEEDGSSTFVYDFEVLLTEPKGLRDVAQQLLGYNSHFEELTLRDLATVKADGRVIPVDPRAINDQPESADPSSPYFDEQRIKMIAFPDITPGDRARGRAVYTSKRPKFPGQFAQFWALRPDRPPETVELTLSGPVSRPLQINAINVDHRQERVENRIVHHVVFRHESPTVLFDATDSFDTAPRFEASTFADYAAFAALLKAWNAPMAIPDAGVRELARQIVGDAADDRLKAERIFNWVVKSIRYVGIGFADGGYISQPVADIVRVRYGDCKAHATVLKALLAAQGIDAELAIVNAGAQYTITSVATPNFDHAIVYLPKFELYLDPTAATASFAALPTALYGKPVLNIDSGRVSKIPLARPEDFVVRTDVAMTLDSNGIRKAQSTLSGQGIGANLSRAHAKRLESSDMKSVARRELESEGLAGTGSYAFPDPREPSDAYAISAPFELTGAVALDRESQLRLFASSDPRPGTLWLIADGSQGGAFRCLPLDSTLSSMITLPDGINVAEKPAAIAYERELAGETRYGPVTGRIKIDGAVVLEGRTVRATRRVTVAFDAPVCPAAFSASIKEVLQKASNFYVSKITATPKPVARVVEAGSAYQLGLAAYRAKNYDAALKHWRPIAEQGDGDAQVYLGSMYKDGNGVPQDYAQAFAWYSKAAEAGHALAQAHLGFMYGNGLGVAADNTQAVAWYRKSAALGDAYAQCNLGEMYENGSGVARDFDQARFWYSKAAAQGSNRAAFLLGLMHDKGKGVTIDFAQAMEWYRKAADKGFALAQLNVGMLYADGRGVPRNYEQALVWFRKATAQGNATAQYNLGYAYENGYGVKADMVEAKQWYTRAANLGHAGAMTRLTTLQTTSAMLDILKRAIGIIPQ